MRDGSSRPYLLTAGHCVVGDSGTWRTQNTQGSTYNIGGRLDWRWGTEGDWALVRVDSSSHWYRTPPVSWVFVDQSNGDDRPSDTPTTYREDYPIYGASTSSVGDVLCFTSGIRLEGAAAGDYTDCGRVLELNRRVTYTGGVSVDGLGVLSSNSSVPGSSGGPYYKSGRGYGLHSGASNSGEQYYQGLSEALDKFNVSLPPA